jgi:hypothetical protein
MPDFIEFQIQDPQARHIVWRVLYHPGNPVSWWTRLYKDQFGRLIPGSSFISPAEDPIDYDDLDLDWYGGLA